MDDLYSYLWQSSSIIALWLLLYKLFFNKITYFKTNRIYLLIGLLFSFAIPLLNFESELAFTFSTKSNENLNLTINYYNISNTQRIENNTSNLIEKSSSELPKEQNINWDYSKIIYIIYLIGLSLFLLKLVFNVTKLIKNINSNIYRKESYKNIKCIVSKDKIPAFSFLRTIYISENDYTSIHSTNILEHELIHIKQKHSLDLILIETLKLILWFNPLLYYYSKCIKDNHEFEVDNTIIQNHSDKSSYYISLVDHTLGAHFVDLPSYFNKSTLKRRFEMLNTRKSSKFSLIRYTAIIPFIAVFFFLFACSKPDYNRIANSEDNRNAEYLLNKPIKMKKYDLYFTNGNLASQGVLDFFEESRYLLTELLELDNKENAAEFTLNFDINEKGGIENLKIIDTTWLKGLPNNRNQKIYAAVVFNYFKNSTKWKPSIINGKPSKVNKTLDLFYGSGDSWLESHQPTLISYENHDFTKNNYNIAITIPETYDKKQNYSPLRFDDKLANTLIKLMKFPNIANPQKSVYSEISFNFDSDGTIYNIKSNFDKYNPDQNQEFDKSAITALKTLGKINRFSNKMQINNTKLLLKILFLHESDHKTLSEKYLGFDVFVGNFPKQGFSLKYDIK